jgi:hypothetical protein
VVPLRLTRSGRYVVVARAKGFSNPSGQFFSPWSPPVVIHAKAPFDVAGLTFPDPSGPT